MLAECSEASRISIHSFGVPMAEGDTRPIHLNECEREVLLLLAEGKTDAEIGIIFNLSAKTINYRVEEIKRKFGVGTRIQAVVTALRRGLIK